MSTQIISFNCVLKNRVGHLISTTYSRNVLTTTNDKNAPLLGLSEGLQNIKSGEKRSITLKAEQAYGYYDPKKIILYPRKRLPSNLVIGETVTIVGKSGTHRSYNVVQFLGDMISLDGNHPLAGQDLVFEIEVLAARVATKEELDDAEDFRPNQFLN